MGEGRHCMNEEIKEEVPQILISWPFVHHCALRDTYTAAEWVSAYGNICPNCWKFKLLQHTNNYHSLGKPSRASGSPEAFRHDGCPPILRPR